MTSPDRRLAALAEVAAVADPNERVHAAQRSFGKRWFDMLLMWRTEGGRFGDAS